MSRLILAMMLMVGFLMGCSEKELNPDLTVSQAELNSSFESLQFKCSNNTDCF